MENLVTTTQGLLAVYGLRILVALVILVVGRIVARWLKGLLERTMERRGVEAMLVSFVSNLTYYALLAFVVIAALSKLGIQTASLIAVVGAAGLAIGLALQGSLQNFAAGVLIVVFRPYRVGDFIEGGGTAGSVERMEIFMTWLRTPDNRTVVIPNGELTRGAIVNYSARDTRRLDLVIGVGYDDDLTRVREVLLDILATDERVLKEPEPLVGVLEHADSSINFAVRPWVRRDDYWPLRYALLEEIKRRFDAEGITIPYPQRDVHLDPATQRDAA